MFTAKFLTVVAVALLSVELIVTCSNHISMFRGYITEQQAIAIAKTKLYKSGHALSEFQCGASLHPTGALNHWALTGGAASGDLKTINGFSDGVPPRASITHSDKQAEAGYWEVSCSIKGRKLTGGLSDGWGIEFIRVDRRSGLATRPMVIS